MIFKQASADEILGATASACIAKGVIFAVLVTKMRFILPELELSGVFDVIFAQIAPFHSLRD